MKVNSRRFLFRHRFGWSSAAGLALIFGLMGLPGGCVQRGLQNTTYSADCHKTVRDCSMLPSELPEGYTLINDKQVLRRLGMRNNPGYVSNRYEMAAMTEHGASVCFASIYGRDGGIRLMLNGILFTKTEALELFVMHQQMKNRAVTAFRRPVADGEWLLMIARDPDMAYPESELNSLHDGVLRYRDRLGLVTVFDEILRGRVQI